MRIHINHNITTHPNLTYPHGSQHHIIIPIVSHNHTKHVITGYNKPSVNSTLRN